jgi:fatty acid desaturase
MPNPYRSLRMREAPAAETIGGNHDRRKIMSIDRVVLAFAGAMVMLSLVLAYLVSPYWLALAGFVGLNLLQSAFTGFCPLAIVLKKLGYLPGAAFN